MSGHDRSLERVAALESENKDIRAVLRMVQAATGAVLDFDFGDEAERWLRTSPRP